MTRQEWFVAKKIPYWVSDERILNVGYGEIMPVVLDPTKLGLIPSTGGMVFYARADDNVNPETGVPA
jgi:hypothetical protein